MKIISTIKEFQKWRKGIKGSIGFVPTMGALHNGHLSLIKSSNSLCEYTVVSIYLNPTQFAPHEDLNSYPKNIDKDLNKLLEYSVECVFLPNDSEMYPLGFNTYVNELDLSQFLEGERRPNFFKGVTTIVAKLFNIILPTHAFFGAKDAQQLLIIKKMVIDLAYDIKILECPIIREKNGLAMSSRNEYLSSEEKNIASNIYKALKRGKELIHSGETNVEIIREGIINFISYQNMMQIDYVSIVDAETLIELSEISCKKILVSIAVFIGKTRLIDNFTYYN